MPRPAASLAEGGSGSVSGTVTTAVMAAKEDGGIKPRAARQRSFSAAAVASVWSVLSMYTDAQGPGISYISRRKDRSMTALCPAPRRGKLPAPCHLRPRPASRGNRVAEA